MKPTGVLRRQRWMFGFRLASRPGGAGGRRQERKQVGIRRVPFASQHLIQCICREIRPRAVGMICWTAAPPRGNLAGLKRIFKNRQGEPRKCNGDTYDGPTYPFRAPQARKFSPIGESCKNAGFPCPRVPCPVFVGNRASAHSGRVPIHAGWDRV